jgi:hypothetical protein
MLVRGISDRELYRDRRVKVLFFFLGGGEGVRIVKKLEIHEYVSKEGP